MMQLVRNSMVVLFIASLLSITSCGDEKRPAPAVKSVFPYQQNSEYVSVLKSCAQSNTIESSCQLSNLPTVGMENDPVTKEAIMDRVVVSHEWMGLRFEQLLDQMPDELIQLFGAITLVAIADDIRPSYYQPASGGIYLDPAGLWLTQSDKAVISRDPDYRAAFADPMGFRVFAKYTKGNAEAFQGFGLDSPEDRTVEDIVIPMASLLFHELAHANDTLPPSQYNDVERNQSFYSATQRVTQVSSVLDTMFSLESAQMYRLAEVLFAGSTPSDADLARTAPEVGGFFEADQASDNYSYFTRFEDLAMLFEEAMLKKHFDVDRNLGFVTNPAEPTDCNSYVVGWGARNRIGDPEVKIRAEWVASQLLPGVDHSAFFTNLPEPTLMETSKGWCDALIIPGKDERQATAADEPQGPPPEERAGAWSLDQMTRLYAPFTGLTE